MRRRTVFSLIACCALSACAHQQTPNAMPGMAWSLTHVDGEGAKLAFGQPQSDNVLVMMSCEPRTGGVVVSVNASAASARPALELSSRGKSSRYAGQAAPSGLGDGALVEASASANDPVLASFARTGELAVTVDGRRTALPAGDRGEARRFLASCQA